MTEALWLRKQSGGFFVNTFSAFLRVRSHPAGTVSLPYPGSACVRAASGMRDGLGLIMLFKGMREMLAAVVAAGKGDIRDLHGAVRQQKGSLFEPLLCNIADDGAAHLPRKQKLQIGFVNTGMCGDQRDSQRLEKVLLNIGAGLFQIGGALCPAGVLRAEEKFQNHSGKEKPHQLPGRRPVQAEAA